MAEIRIEGNVVNFEFVDTFFDHLYLVYVDDMGSEFVIRGGPTEYDLSNNLPGNSPFGPIKTESGFAMDMSEDARELSQREAFGSRIIDLGGRDATTVWEAMKQTANLIGSSSTDYFALDQNSNSTIASVLHSVGISISTTLPDPEGINAFPGISNQLLDDFSRIFETGTGTSVRDDVFVGGRLNDRFEGGGGNDRLDGGGGVADVAVFSGNCSEYDIEKLPDGTIKVVHVGGSRADGTDTLTAIEIAEFADGRTIDLTTANPGCSNQDIAFVIDTTGSMSDDIEEVKLRANEIIASVLGSESGDVQSRIAVVGYNDPFTETITTFTDDAITASNAINGIRVSGGGDIPEVVFAGLLHALDGRAGDWREDAGARRIILFGDAPAKDMALADEVYELARNLSATIPSLPSGTTTRLMQVDQLSPGLTRTTFELIAPAAATTTGAIGSSVEIFTVQVGNDSNTASDFREIATATGGRILTTVDASGLVDALVEAIETPTGAQLLVNAYENLFFLPVERAPRTDALLINDIAERLSTEAGYTLNVAFQDLVDQASGTTGAIAAAYQTFFGGVPSIAGFEFLVRNALDTDFGSMARDGGINSRSTFNVENRFINIFNALAQGNEEAKSVLSNFFIGNNISETVQRIYTAIVDTSGLNDNEKSSAIEFLTRPDALQLYSDGAFRILDVDNSGTVSAAEEGILSFNEALAASALATLTNILVREKTPGIGEDISTFLQRLIEDQDILPASGDIFTSIGDGLDIPGDISTGARIESGRPITEKIAVSDDIDWFILTPTVSGNYRINLGGSGDDPLSDPYLSVFDKNGSFLDSDDDSGIGRNSELFIYLNASEDVYIEATAYGSGTGTYELFIDII